MEEISSWYDAVLPWDALMGQLTTLWSYLQSVLGYFPPTLNEEFCGFQ